MGLDMSGIYKATKWLYFGFNGFFDLKKNDLTSYNALVLFKAGKAKVSVEHQSVPSENISFGNWMARLYFKGDKYRVGGRALFSRANQSASFEIGGKYKQNSDHTWRWKVRDSDKRWRTADSSPSEPRPLSSRPTAANSSEESESS